MAMQIYGGVGTRAGRPGGRRKHGRKTLMSEINVTPFVDVMLVLLIIFMVTAPLLASGIKVNLPEAPAKPLVGQDEPLIVSVNEKREVFIQDTKIDLSKLGGKLSAITDNNVQARIFIRGDKNVDYGFVIDVISVINSAGFTKVGLVTESGKR